MPRLLPSLAYALSVVFTLTACQTSQDTEAATRRNQRIVVPSPPPIIDGEWSGGMLYLGQVRMAVRQLVRTNSDCDDVLLLLFVENMGGNPVNWPGIRMLREVESSAWESAQEAWVGNLLITVEPLDGQAEMVGELRSSGGGLQQNVTPLAPGETRLFALHLYDVDQSAKDQMRQQVPDAIYTQSANWPGLSQATGRWRLHFTYRSGGIRFPSVPGEPDQMLRTDLFNFLPSILVDLGGEAE